MTKVCHLLREEPFVHSSIHHLNVCGANEKFYMESKNKIGTDGKSLISLENKLCLPQMFNQSGVGESDKSFLQ